MSVVSKSPKALLVLAMLAGPASVSLAQEPPEADLSTTVYTDTAEMTAGPEVEGFISARKDDRIQITTADGSNTVVSINDATEIRSSGGFLGLARNKLAAESLLNGLPVTIKTWQSGSELIANQISLKSRDLKTATMIRSGTAQGFAEQTAATEALRSRMADIDKYNVKSTTNVYFDWQGRALEPGSERSVRRCRPSRGNG
jgi:OOP family OmpA-OmpF porin